MNPVVICSVLIPSRGRPERLKRTITSIWETARSVPVEIWIRFDDDDNTSLAVIAELERDPRGRVRVAVGPRLCGYPSIGDFYAELCALSIGDWIWIMNDDAHVTGAGWDAQLAQIPTEGFIVQPECYQLGHSKYWSSEGGAFPVVPANCWTKLGAEFLRGAAVDTWLDQLLRVQNGWQTKFLTGVAVVHERDADDVLAKHREL